MELKKITAGRRFSVIRCVKYVSITAVLVVLSYVLILAFPQFIFSHHLTYGNYEVWSDQPIAPDISKVLDDATRRLRTSELYEPDRRNKVFFCNTPWRMFIYSQRFTDRIGGSADSWLTENVYIRSSDIAANRIHSPDAGSILDADQRPLSYFIAHEITHIMESREFGRLMYILHPEWLTEGYADYIGKGGDFSFEENRKLLAENSPLLDHTKSGLYRRFHLEVLFLISKKGMTVKQIFANPPHEGAVLELLKATP